MFLTFLAFLCARSMGIRLSELPPSRSKGFGAKVMRAGLEVAAERFAADSVTISAQTHAIGFYEKCGFKTVSEVYMEEGIPHVKMICKL